MVTSGLWPSLKDQIEWCLCGPSEAAEAGRSDDSLHLLLASLSAQTHPHLLRPGTGRAQQSRERIIDAPHRVQIVLKVVIGEGLDDHPRTIVGQGRADMRSSAHRVSHVVEAVEDRHEV